MAHAHAHSPGPEHAHEGGDMQHSHGTPGTAHHAAPDTAPYAAPPVHRHPDGQEHSHDGGDVRHTHEGEYIVREEVTTTTKPGGFAMRIILTLLGAAGMIVGAYYDWILEVSPSRGVDLGYTVFWTPNAEPATTLWESAGFVVIVLGALALIGLAFRTGWLTSLAGALGIASMVLLAITFYRETDVDLGVGDFGLGAWLIVGGGLLALIGGFFGPRRTMIVRDRELIRT